MRSFNVVFNLELGYKKARGDNKLINFRKHRYKFICDVQIGIEMITVPGLVIVHKKGNPLQKTAVYTNLNYFRAKVSECHK